LRGLEFSGLSITITVAFLFRCTPTATGLGQVNVDGQGHVLGF
jgi:hypothetical protein